MSHTIMHSLLEHRETIALAFTQKDPLQELLFRKGIDGSFFARHFGIRIVDEMVQLFEQNDETIQFYTLEIIELFFNKHGISFNEDDRILLKQGIYKTLKYNTLYLTPEEFFCVEKLFNSDTIVCENYFNHDEIEEMHDLLDDLEHFSSQLSVDLFFQPEIIPLIEKSVIFIENYGHILHAKTAFLFLSNKLFILALTLRQLIDFEGQERFEEVCESLRSFIILLRLFHEQVIQNNDAPINSFDTSLTHSIDNIIEMFA